jgi:hypothetical protein
VFPETKISSLTELSMSSFSPSEKYGIIGVIALDIMFYFFKWNRNACYYNTVHDRAVFKK